MGSRLPELLAIVPHYGRALAARESSFASSSMYVPHANPPPASARYPARQNHAAIHARSPPVPALTPPNSISAPLCAGQTR